MNDQSMKKIAKVYLTNNELDKEIEDFNGDKYIARFSKTEERYIFALCKDCNGPMLGHKETDCKDIDWNDQEIVEIKKMLENLHAYEKTSRMMEGNEDLVEKRKPNVWNSAGMGPRVAWLFPLKLKQ